MQKVEAYKDESGELHDSELGAARADAKLRLEKILGGKAEVCVTAILQEVEAIHTAITPLVEASIGAKIVQRKPILELDAKDLTDEQRLRYPNTVGPL